MKKALSLTLGVLMVVGIFAAFAITSSADDDTYLWRYGNGMENWTGSPNKGDQDAVTQILICPSPWDANAIGEVGNAKCGDIMKMYLKIKDDIVEDVKFETFGCGSAIASSSMATEMIKGKPLSEVRTLTNKAVTEALDGLPAHKIHCSVLAEEAIQSALEDYERRQKEKAES